MFGRRRQDASPGERALWGELMSLGMVFPIAITLGFFIGRWAGGLLGHPRIGMGIGLAWGVAAGFWELYKTTVRLERLDAKQEDPGDRGRHPDGPGGPGQGGDGPGE